jgi:hypothetical protein
MADDQPSFVCLYCGKTHVGLRTDIAYRLPDDVWAIPGDDRAARAQFTDDLCEFGDRRFIRCILLVPLIGSTNSFGWGIWVETTRSVSDRYVALYQEDATAEPPHAGTIANRIPPYSDALGAAVLIRFGLPNDRPVVEFPPGARSTLAQEQRQGIDTARHHEVLAAADAI